MSTTEGGATSGATPPANEFTPITTQDDLNKIIQERVAREQAKFSDHAELKIKAAELDQIKAANQSEADKAKAEADKTAKRIGDLEAELNNTRLETLRLKIAGDHKITDAEDITLFLTGTDVETLTAQAKRLAERDADAETNRKKTANKVPKEGTTTDPSADEDDREFVRSLFGSAE